MDYIQLDCYCADTRRDNLIAYLADIGFEGFVENEDGFSAFIPQHMYQEPGIANDIKELEDTFDCDFGVRVVEDQNWNELWESTFQPVIVEDLCGIRASFHKPLENVQHEIIIDPKMSFGTGHHQTTVMVVKIMVEYDFKNKNVLDYGTGTGILAILASKLGAREIHAIDIDYWAFENTKENMLLNDTSNIIPLQGDKKAIPEIRFDTILANINKNVICDSLQLLSNRLKSGGILITSGYYCEDTGDISEEAAKYSLKQDKKLELENWCCTSFVKE